jgi:glycerate dehydrogenase
MTKTNDAVPKEINLSPGANRLKRLVVLDRIILLKRQWEELRSMADELVEYAGLDPREIMRRLEKEADQVQAPMCWTQLAQEEMTVKELNNRLAGADAVITCWTNIPDEVLLANPQLRYVGFWTNLVDHRVNLELAAQRGIQVTYIPDYGTDSVAEMTFAGMLAVNRRLMDTVNDTRRGSWTYELLKTGKRVPTIEQIPQRMLRGKKLGVLGFGQIGQRVAELAMAFKMEISYWSRKRRPDWEQRGVRFRELDELFSWTDILSVHLSPYGPAQVVSRERLALLRDGGIFVNTSAGRLVDQEALWDELRSRRINAYIDVYENLPPRKIIAELMSQNNVFTYRAAWFTQEAVTYKGDRLVENLREWLDGSR